MEIKLVRHDVSKQNTHEEDAVKVGDHNISLTDTIIKSPEAAKLLGADYLRNALLYCSPYRRTRQTKKRILTACGIDESEVRVFEDPRLREVEHGYENTVEAQEPLREVHGWFFYRFEGGESPADCYDRLCTFIESMHRQAKRMKRRSKNGKRPNIVIFTHGLTIRCFVMRYLHLTVEQYDSIHNPENCDIITLAKIKDLPEKPQFTSGKWGVNGLRLRQDR